jgi:cytochrome c peroxidase
VVLKLKVLILFFALLAAAATVIKPPFPRRLPSPNPKDWPKATVDLFATNPLTEEGFQLGRHLFYDVRLSRDNTIACASCHQQYSAFANADHDFSHGYNNSYTNRNAAAVFNVAWMKQLHWDGSINHVEVQPLAPITAPNEMAADMPTVLKKLNADTLYKRLTRAAFGTSLLTSQRMLKALAQRATSCLKYIAMPATPSRFLPAINLQIMACQFSRCLRMRAEKELRGLLQIAFCLKYQRLEILRLPALTCTMGVFSPLAR